MPDNRNAHVERNKNLTVIKFIELILSVACLYFHYYSFDDGDVTTSFLATGTFCGFIVILIATFASLLVKSKINKRIDIFYSLIGAALFVTSGIFIIEEWQHAFRTRTRDTAMLKGALSIVNGIIFIFDCIFTFKDT